jgi:dephospho-CoA kinase
MRRPFRLGLTGSIGMGKSTTAAMFRDEGVPVWDADEAVRRLYASGGAGAEAVARICPDAIDAEGGVLKDVLRDRIAADPPLLNRITAVVHPLVAADRKRFLADCPADIVVLDIPLLYETGGEQDCDAVLVVTAPPEVQRRRLLARGGMTEAELGAIMARQMPDADKRKRADYVIETRTLDQTRAEVRALLNDLRERKPDA